MEIQGYRLTEQLFSSRKTVIYRGLRQKDALPVVLKILVEEYPSALELAQFQREYEILERLQGDGVIGAHGLTQVGSSSVQVLEDFGAESLGSFQRRQHPRGLPLALFLSISTQIVTQLQKIHGKSIIHKDINPSNVLINPSTLQVKLADFGISSLLGEEHTKGTSSHALEGTLAYISPEQTGRMNRWIDHRSDLYSLGMTFYELLSGVPAFQGTDPMELVHAHIAKIPSPIGRLRPELPAVLARIVHKCIEKNAEDRYQSAAGLLFDLARCQEELGARGEIADFAIGEKDQSDRFTIPQKLYGREKEKEFLLERFEAVCAGATQLVLIGGVAGIGKSTLVQEIHKPVVARHGRYVAGKFDQLKRDIPYCALVMGFRELIRDLMKETPDELARWKQTLLEALGTSGKVITDLLPELTWLIGEPPPVPELPPSESRNRLQVILQRFVHAFTRDQRPLTLFVDDLQWADPASLSLIQALICNPDNDRVLILAAYRDNEVDPAHPLHLAVGEIEKTLPRALHRLCLSPLAPTHVRALVEETLLQKGEQVAALASVCAEKTGGNPFFLCEFLRALRADGLIRFDAERAGWTFDLGAIQARKTTDNLAELMIARIDELAEPERLALQQAACLGFQFDLHSLARLLGASPGKTAARLERAQESRLIIALDDAYKYQTDAPAANVRYQFHHDKIQQAAYSLLTLERQRESHIHIGRVMWAGCPAAERGARSFEIAGHFNLAHELIRDPQERLEVGRINLLAGQKAKGSAAYQPALRFFENAVLLFEDGWWQDHHEMGMSIFNEGAQAAYLAGDFARMEQYLAVSLAHSRSLLDTVAAHEVRLVSLIASDKPNLAIHEGLRLLRLLGEGLPARANPAHVLLSLARTKLLLGRKRPEELLALPSMEDPTKLAVMRILLSFSEPTYFYNMNLYVVLVLKLVQLSLRHGNSAYSCAGYAGYAVLTAGALLAVDEGDRFGKLAFQLVDRFRAERLRGLVAFAVNTFVLPWKAPLRETLPGLLEAYLRAVEGGDYIYGSHAAANYGYHGLFAGVPLAELMPTVQKIGERLPGLKHTQSVDTCRAFLQAMQNLKGEAPDPLRLKGTFFDEDESLPVFTRENRKINLWDIHSLKLFLAVYWNAPGQAIDASDAASRYQEVTLGLYCQPMYCFLDTLARCALLSAQGPIRRRRWLLRIGRQIRKMRKWARGAPMNYQHKLCLMRAERARVRGKPIAAGALYDQAITLAQEHGFQSEEALACELAGRFYLASHRGKIGQVYLKDALLRYQRWGALAKVESMKKEYGAVLLLARGERATQEATVTGPFSLTATQSSSTSSSTVGSASGESSLDFASLLKASMTISAEVELQSLVVKLMQILVENAGADRAALLLEREGELTVHSSLDISRDPITRFRSLPLAQAEDLSAAIPRYVFRTRHVVVLGDAVHKGAFTDDPYVVRCRPKSILGLPILHHNQLTGVLYLENNQTYDAFTPQRVEVLWLLSAQAAISIENAKLYSDLKQSSVQLGQALEQARTSDRVKSELLARASHELRTPLNAIINIPKVFLDGIQETETLCCQACQVELQPETPEERAMRTCPSCGAPDALQPHSSLILRESLRDLKAGLATVYNAGNGLLQVVKGVLDMSRLESGTLLLTPGSLELSEVITEVVNSLDFPSRDRGLGIAVSARFAGIRLTADRVKLTEAFYNLVSNAIKFSLPGQRVELDCRVEEREVVVSVADHGIGIAPENHELIFEPFYQVESGNTRRFGGTGLGLTVTQKIVKLHGGRVWVESALSQGSTFYVALPLDGAGGSS